jgi:hypothetical protein
MIRLCAAALAASLATLAIAGDKKEILIHRVTQEIPPPVLVRGESPMVISLAAGGADFGHPATFAIRRRSQIWLTIFRATAANC